MTNTPSLRPRDIQTRIRGGESVEEVAAAAGTSVEKIMPFAAPVLAEREHIADRAQKASVRRQPGEPAGTVRVLGDAVAARVRDLDLEPDAEWLTWDSARRHDGRWRLTALIETAVRTGTAEFTFDTAGNYVSADNDDAHWLVGDRPATPTAPSRDDLAAVRERRIQPEPYPADVGRDGTQDAATSDTEESVLPLEAFFADEKTEESQAQTEISPDPEPTRAPKPSRRKRASVPSWDEIMFGGKND